MTACGMSFDAVLRDLYPGAVPQASFVDGTLAALAPLGFTADNAIACVGTCRDELCRPLFRDVEDVWGEAFNFSSLAGMLFLGRTGFGAAHAHAPIDGGRERYVYFAMPHIALGEGGEVGRCERPGRPGPSVACGALAAVVADLEVGRHTAELDPDDVEQSLLKEVLLARLGPEEEADLTALTALTGALILETLERMIDLTVDTAAADYAVVTGTLIHGPEGRDLVQPATCYAMVGGERGAVSV